MWNHQIEVLYILGNIDNEKGRLQHLEQAFSLQLYCKRDPSADVFLWILWNISEHLFYRTLRGNYFWLFKYIKVDKNVSKYCYKDIKVISVPTTFVTLRQLRKFFYMLRKRWKPPSRKSYKNLRNFQEKISAVEFRCSQTISLRFTVTQFHCNLDEKIMSNEQK